MSGVCACARVQIRKYGWIEPNEKLDYEMISLAKSLLVDTPYFVMLSAMRAARTKMR